jgi:hypothetical protein
MNEAVHKGVFIEINMGILPTHSQTVPTMFWNRTFARLSSLTVITKCKFKSPGSS